MKIEQEIMEMFDKEILYRNGDGTRHGCMSISDEQKLKSFISHIITLVQKDCKEEMVEFLEEYKESHTFKALISQREANKPYLRGLEDIIKLLKTLNK